MKIYELLRKIRKEQKMTQQELADKVHLTVQAINQYEAGKREIKAEMLTVLLKALGYDFSIQETFQDKEIVAIEWDLSFYHEYLNEYGMIYADFKGAKEISKETFDALQTALRNNDFLAASKILEEETKHLPDEGDVWDTESWEQFFEEATMKQTEHSFEMTTTTEINANDWDQYNYGSFLTVKTCLLSEIKDKKCTFNRMAYD